MERLTKKYPVTPKASNAASTDATFRNTVHEPLGVASTMVRPAFSYAVLARR